MKTEEINLAKFKTTAYATMETAEREKKNIVLNGIDRSCPFRVICWKRKPRMRSFTGTVWERQAVSRRSLQERDSCGPKRSENWEGSHLVKWEGRSLQPCKRQSPELSHWHSELGCLTFRAMSGKFSLPGGCLVPWSFEVVTQED